MNLRLLIDIDTSVEKIIEKYGKDFNKIKYHILGKPAHSSIISLIVDESLLLVVDIKDDSQEIFEDSVGLGTYSNIESTVDTYLSIFEKAWYQTK